MSEDATTWQRVKDLVGDALEHGPAERAAFLDGLQEETPEVRARVRLLVNAAEESRDSGDPLEQAAEAPVGGTRLSALASVDWTGRTLGGYAVRRFVARGGMGEVYEAVQETTGRRVALKLLSGASSNAWRTRFRHEVGILARLEHPAIAQILDADVHVDESGREFPYIALEYVDGKPLTAYAETQNLSVERRIELLLEVCGGVQHAHQRGVIHRDLKPENILVMDPGDGTAQPKVLDFGVARVFGDDDEHFTHLTREGELVGTLSYMSPEQVLGQPDAVDTRSDVHGLGVLLFQLLTGKLPIDLSGASLPEAVQRLRESLPAAPSSIDQALRGDLDTICETAMARERAARYQSVSELAADLGRYLRREPITARPASRIYHLRMFARRHKGLVAGLVVAAAVLVIGSITTTVGFVHAKEEAERANAEARRTRDANRFLGEILSAADPEILGRDATLRDVLDVNAPRIDEVFAHDDRTRAELHATVGWTYHNLGEVERARTHLEAARDLFRSLDGPNAEATLVAERVFQSVVLESEGTSDEALSSARSLAERTAEQLGPTHAEALGARTDLAYVLAGRGEFEEALEIARATYDDSLRTLGSHSETTSTIGSNLSAILVDCGEYDQAIELQTELYECRVEQHGASHPRSLRCLINLATAISLADRRVEALAAFDRALADGRDAWDADHPLMILLTANRASALSGLGRYEEAINAYREVHELRRARLGPNNAQTLSALFNLGVNLTYAERLDEAEAAARQLLEQAESCDGCEEGFQMRAIGLLASVLSDLGRKEEAAPLSQRAVEEHVRLLGADHFQTLIQANNHAHLLSELERHDESIALFEETIATWQVEYPDVASVLRTLRWNHARALASAGRNDEAEAELQLVNELEAQVGPNPRPTRLEVLERMAELYDALGRTADAEACRTEAESLRAAGSG